MLVFPITQLCLLYNTCTYATWTGSNSSGASYTDRGGGTEGSQGGANYSTRKIFYGKKLNLMEDS